MYTLSIHLFTHRSIYLCIYLFQHIHIFFTLIFHYLLALVTQEKAIIVNKKCLLFFGSHFGYIKFYFYLTSFFTPICFIFNFYICQNFNPSLFIHDFVLFMICVEVARRHGLCIKGSAPFNLDISYNFNHSLFIHDFVFFVICVEVARRHGLCIKGSAPFNFVISYNSFSLFIQDFVFL